ncbi:MAG: M55 family metallopeptidase [Methanobacteriota archaeon]|nr:MAG: M55 family metallopeptidase [Euryarchaeota archaeon]
MRVHITVDMEGMAGMAHEDQADMKGLDFPRMRELLTNEVQAAIEGAKAGGAKEFVVCDAHDTGRNLIYEKLDKDVTIIEGTAYGEGMMGGISADFDAAFQIGYHSMRDTHAGTIGHTYSYDIAELYLNDIKMGESGLASAIAGHFNVPVVLVSGDAHAVREAQSLMKDVVGVPTKEGVGVYGAKSLTPDRACELIREGATKAMGKVATISPYVVNRPVKLGVVFTRTIMAQYVSQMPLVERTNGESVVYEAKDMIEAFRVFEAMMMIASSAGREGYL